MNKVCCICNKNLELNMFGPVKKHPDGLSYECRPCLRIKQKAWRKSNPEGFRNIQLKKRYGITVTIYNNMLIEQDYGCKICKTKPIKNEPLHIDHCHKTGLVRGLLCRPCNQGLGFFKDNTELMALAIAYLVESDSNE